MANIKELFVTVLDGTVCSIIFIVILTAMPIAYLVVGSLYKGQCPIEEKIPIYLIVGGAFGLVPPALRLCNKCCTKKGKDGEENPNAGGKAAKALSALGSLIGAFLCAWFICGCVWVYRNYSSVQFDDPDLETYCHKTLYLFTFWMLNIFFILLGLFIMVYILLLCGGICCPAICSCLGSDDDDRGTEIKFDDPEG